jgi:hypothetical protein
VPTFQMHALICNRLCRTTPSNPRTRANGAIQINHSVLEGRLFGGDTHNEAIVSGASIFAPVPEPTTGALLTFSGLAPFILRRKHS